MGPIVVSDTSPLLYLVSLDCIEILPQMYGTIATTEDVLIELSNDSTPAKAREWALAPPRWLNVQTPKVPRQFDSLGAGESSAIALALELSADAVLLDERAGSAVAKNLGLRVMGTLSVLIDAGVDGHIDFEHALKRLTRDTSFYATERLLQAARDLYIARCNNR